MSIQMIVTDLDGTLLRTDKTISEYTESVFKRCRRKGIKIAFATARPERNTAAYSSAIAPDAVISNNGAKISVNGQIISIKEISPAAVTGIVGELLSVEGIRLSLDYESFSVTNCEDYQSWGMEGVTYSDFSAYEPGGVQKIAIEATDRSLLKKVDFDRYGCHFYGHQGEKWYMVTEKSATKRKAVKEAAAFFGVSIADVAAFGDDYNDMEMLRVCGVGVAVGNAIDDLKAIADCICDANDDDGVAKWIERYI